jgi:hypothetical protein
MELMARLQIDHLPNPMFGPAGLDARGRAWAIITRRIR